MESKRASKVGSDGSVASSGKGGKQKGSLVEDSTNDGKRKTLDHRRSINNRKSHIAPPSDRRASVSKQKAELSKTAIHDGEKEQPSSRRPTVTGAGIVAPKKRNSESSSEKHSTASSLKGAKHKHSSTAEEPSSNYETDHEQTDLELGPDDISVFADSEEGDEYKSDVEKVNSSLVKEEKAKAQRERTRSAMLKSTWAKISLEVQKTFDSPTRVFKLRGYHSEPDLSLPFEEKFEMFMDQMDGSEKRSLKRTKEKFVSLEDIAFLAGKEHPSLVRGGLSERFKTSAISDKLKCTWLELAELEKKRFSFFDELFAMGYVVDSLEVPSPPPKGDETKASAATQGEYFVEAEERHYRKKVDYGRVVFKTKHVYTGHFQDWYFQGSGRYCWEDGTVYQGEFARGVMDGPGSIHWPDGCIYEGHFIDGIRTGWGVYSSADGQTFAGEWMDGLPHGHGKMWYDPEDDDNDYYEGQWEKGLPQGIGTRQYATGDRYVGNWSQGMRNGYGIMIWLKERQVFKGEWLNGVPHGFGKHIWYLERTASNSFPTRHVYHGAWNMGMREGIGKMIYPCGSVYEGRWKNGQRHGKGMFINPAGDILVGLFRAGAIIGGSEVPLHAPTYECDYGGLTEWLTAKFSMELREGNADEENLNNITKQYLPYIRKLYQRAGEYSQKYGNHGLYPAYMKKFHLHHGGNKSKHAFHREYSRNDEPDHMKGKGEKPDSLDGVNPVTRFGLWCLLRDCDNLLDEVTMAYYDRIWCDTPPLSFQTRHNPFEPVYLWQFLQALIVAATSYYIDIPQLNHNTSENDYGNEEPGVSETTLNSGISYEEHKRQMLVRQLRSRSNKYSSESVPNPVATNQGDNNPPAVKLSMHRSKTKTKKDTTKKKGRGNGKSVAPAIDLEAGEKPGRASSTGKAKKSDARGQSISDEGNKGREEELEQLAEATDGDTNAEEETSYIEFPGEDFGGVDRRSGDMRKSVSWSRMREFRDENDEPVGPRTPAPSTIADCFETFLVTKLLPCLKRDPGANLPVVPQPLPALVDMYDAFKSVKDREVLKGTEFIRSTLPHLLFPNPNDALWWHRSPEPLSINVELGEIFRSFRERFADEEPEEGERLDEFLYSRHRASEGSTNGNDYLGENAQHSDQALQILNLETDANGKSFSSFGVGGTETDEEADCEPQRTIIGVGRNLATARATMLGNMLNLSDSEDSLGEFIADGNPFAEEDVAPAPFLWADDYKCIPTPKRYQQFVKITTNDVFNVLHQLYPKLCVGAREKDLNFDLIFCDWLWCTSLLAKTSTEREFKDAWKVKEEKRPLMNPQSLGVYAHYLKQIKNNPYLSPTPPPGFQPRLRTRQPEEKRNVKFSL